MKYFSYDPNGNGMQFYETEAAARADAEDAFDTEKGEAGVGWSEEVTEICWGEVKQHIVEVSRRPVMPEDSMPDCDEVVDYRLVDVGA